MKYFTAILILTAALMKLHNHLRKALPTVNLSILNSLCEDASSIILSNGSPLGGTYDGNGVFNGNFYPDSTGVGVFNISYTSELNGCFATDSSYIEVFALPTLNVSLCQNYVFMTHCY